MAEGAGKSTIHILIADDHQLLREGLRRLLETNPNFVVISEAVDGSQAIAKARRLKPDIILLDLSMPKVSGLDVLKELGKSQHSRIIVLAAAIEKRQMDQAIEYGARGIVLKASLTARLFQAIETVAAGEFWLLDKPMKKPVASKTVSKHQGHRK